MKLDKLLAMSAYAVQALATLGLVFAVSRLLSGAEYGHYSLIVASAQSASVLAFEWVRLAASRFCSNVEAHDTRFRKDTIQAAFAGAALTLVALAGGAAVVGALSYGAIGLGLLVALLIGITDLLLVFLRAQGSFNQFALLQTVRAFTLLGSSVLGAFWGRTATSALMGLCAGYAITLLAYVFAAPSWWQWRSGHVRAALFKEMAVYGVSVAAASNLHLQVPLLIRWIGKFFLSADGFAGLSFAMDVLQKPFALVTTAVGGVLTPGVIVEFEKAQDPRSPKLKQLYEVQLWCVCLLLGLALAFIPELSGLISPSLRPWLLLFGPPVALVFAMHTLIQTTIAIPGHLLHMGRRLIVNAAFELGVIALCSGGALYLAELRPIAWLWLGVLATSLSIAFAFPLLMRVPCKRPVEAIYLGCGTAVVLALLYFARLDSLLLSILAKGVVVACISAAGLWLYRPYLLKK
ncbi:MAG: lipopolysaccharide biosynthesis protein [Acidobacteriota bacterium]